MHEPGRGRVMGAGAPVARASSATRSARHRPPSSPLVIPSGSTGWCSPRCLRVGWRWAPRPSTTPFVASSRPTPRRGVGGLRVRGPRAATTHRTALPAAPRTEVRRGGDPDRSGGHGPAGVHPRVRPSLPRRCLIAPDGTEHQRRGDGRSKRHHRCHQHHPPPGSRRDELPHVSSETKGTVCLR